MKKLITPCMIAIVMMACTDQPLQENEKTSAPPSRRCSAAEVLQANLLKDPGLQARMDDIERRTTEAMRSGAVGRINADGKIEIPVVVNVIYRTAAQNVSTAQIQSQIDVLNEDFNKTNADASSIPALFSGVAADVDIQFVLQAVNRRSSNRTSWPASTDRMKKTAQGGINPTDPAHYLNLWVVNKIVDSFGDEVLGYAQFPGGNPATDGVVVGYQFFGRTGTAVAPFNKGRTATHEVGHYLNLRHIWGDTNCGSDLVSDTPTHNTYNFGCPGFPHASTCAGRPTEMTMNYMDYTDDACMYMFSTGQKNRMLALFVSGGAREEMGE